MICRIVTLVAVLICIAGVGNAQVPAACMLLPGYMTLKTALDKAVADDRSGLNNHMWATIVGCDGTVCAVAFSGKDMGAQWLGSRMISAQKVGDAKEFEPGSSGYG